MVHLCVQAKLCNYTNKKATKSVEIKKVFFRIWLYEIESFKSVEILLQISHIIQARRKYKSWSLFFDFVILAFWVQLTEYFLSTLPLFEQLNSSWEIELYMINWSTSELLNSVRSICFVFEPIVLFRSIELYLIEQSFSSNQLYYLWWATENVRAIWLKKEHLFCVWAIVLSGQLNSMSNRFLSISWTLLEEYNSSSLI